MINKILVSGLVFAALSVPTFAATAAAEFYVAQDAKTHACMVMDKKPDGKLMMDAGNKTYASEANAKQALAALKVCAVAPAAAAAAPATPAAAAAPKPAVTAAPAAAATGFYVEQDAKTHACMVDSKAPDGKKMIDVGTKVYETEGRAKQAMAMLKVCKS